MTETFKDHLAQLASAGVFDEDKGLKLKPVQTSYTIDIGQDAYDALTAAEFDRGLKPHLEERLELIAGVENVEYDGSFGPTVFFSILTDCDQPATHDLIRAAIVDQLRRARDLTE